MCDGMYYIIILYYSFAESIWKVLSHWCETLLLNQPLAFVNQEPDIFINFGLVLVDLDDADYMLGVILQEVISLEIAGIQKGIEIL